MKEILLINPSRKRKNKKAPTKKKRAVKAKPSRRKTVKTKGAKMATKKKSAKPRKRRRNPSKKRRSIVRRASKTLAGLNVMGALKESIPLSAGMFGAKFFAKRFGGGADQIDPESWTWRSYLQMAGGAFATGIVANMIKKGTGQKALAGGLSLLMYELVQNEFIQGNETAQGWFGDEYQEEPFIMGDNGQRIPLDDSYRMQLDLPEYAQLPEGMLGSLEPIGPLGDATASPTRLGSVRADLDANYRNMYF